MIHKHIKGSLFGTGILQNDRETPTFQNECQFNVLSSKNPIRAGSECLKIGFKAYVVPGTGIKLYISNGSNQTRFKVCPKRSLLLLVMPVIEAIESSISSTGKEASSLYQIGSSVHKIAQPLLIFFPSSDPALSRQQVYIYNNTKVAEHFISNVKGYYPEKLQVLDSRTLWTVVTLEKKCKQESVFKFLFLYCSLAHWRKRLNVQRRVF